METGFFILALIYVTCVVIDVTKNLVRHRELSKATKASIRWYELTSEQAARSNQINRSVPLIDCQERARKLNQCDIAKADDFLRYTRDSVTEKTPKP